MGVSNIDINAPTIGGGIAIEGPKIYVPSFDDDIYGPKMMWK